MMKHLLAGCLAVLVFCTLQSTPAYADSDNLDFSLVNKTGYGIKEVYVAPHSTDTWSENLSSRPLENGETLDITFPEGEKAAKWDVKIVWVDEGAPVVWMNCKLSKISKFILHYNRDTDETSADTE
ncbi:MAG TPA: hypothetical protein VGD78_10865 [Chthoniobacterales bacterium]